MPRKKNAVRSDDACVLVERGFTWIEQKEFGKALTDFDQALRLDGTNGQAHFGRGRVRYERKEYQAGLEDLERALQCQFVNAEVYRYRGRCHDELFRWKEAFEDFSQVIEALPDDADAFGWRANTLHNRDEYEAALADYDCAIQLGVENAAFKLIRRAQVLKELGRTAEALADLEKSLSYGPDRLEDAGWCYIMAEYWEEDHPEAARQFLAEAFRKEPESEIASVRTQQAEFNESLLDFRKSLRLSPKNGKAFFVRGRLRFEKGEHETALDDLDRALKCQYVTAEVYRYRGKCHDGLDLGAQEIVSDFSEVIRRLPNDAGAYSYRANSLFSLDEFSAASADFDRAIELNADNHAFNFLRRSQALHELGRIDEAFVDLEKGLSYPSDQLPDAGWCQTLAHYWEEEQPEAALRLFVVCSPKSGPGGMRVSSGP